MQIMEATAGGTRRHLRDLVHHLDQQRVQSTVVVAERRDPDFQRDIALFRMEGVNVIPLDMRRRIAPINDWRAVARLVSLIREHEPDVIHAHSAKAGMVARLAARRCGNIPVVYTPHAFAFFSDSPFRALYLVLERWAARYTACLIAVSREEEALALDARHGLGMPPTRVRHIANGLECGTLTTLPPHSPPVVGFVGRLCRQKGPDFFLEVARQLYGENKNIRFKMIGSGPWQKWVERKVARLGLSNCLEICAVRDEVEALDELRDMSVLLMPSRWEGLPYTLLEAMAAGVPVVAMNVGGVGDAIVDGESGILAPVGDVMGLALRARAVLGDRALATRLRDAAHKRLAQFSLSNMIDATTLLYEKLAVASNDCIG